MSKRKPNRSGGRGRRPSGPPPAAGGAGPAAGARLEGGHVRVERPSRVPAPRERTGPDEVFDQMALEPLPEPALQVEPVELASFEPQLLEPEPVETEPVEAEPVEPAAPPAPAPPADAPADGPQRVATPPAEAAADGPPAARVARILLRPRLRRVDLAVAALLGLLGFAVAVQVRSTQDDGLLASARQEDLVRILDDLSNRSDRLRAEVTELTSTRDRLTTGTDRGRAAVEQARQRAQVLGVLAGTAPAEGPGVVLTITDPAGTVRADALLDALEELRDAGAEAVQVEGKPEGSAAAPVARVVASTSFLDDDEGVVVDGTLLRPPYRFTVVGAPETIVRALAIPGGVQDNVADQGGSATVEKRDRVRVGALRPLVAPRYARPAPEASPSAD